MRFSFSGVLAATVAALALGAVASASALAAGPYYYVNGAQYTSTAHKEVEARGFGDTTFKWEFELGATKITMESTGVHMENGYIQGNGAEPGSGNGELVFTGVKVTSPSTCTSDEVSSRVNTKSSKTAVGTIAIPTVNQLSYFEGSDVASTFVPPAEAGERLVEIEHVKGGTCPLSTEYLVLTGHVAAELVEPAAEAEWKTLGFYVFSQSALAALGKAASLEGSMQERINEAGAHPDWTAR